MFVIIFVIAVGLCIGSFANVCIYRIPAGKSIVSPPSTCPSCGRRLTCIELVPVFSFLIQKGRCRGCGEKISWRYPFVELLTGLLFCIIYLKFGFTYETLRMLLFASTLLIIAFIDIDHQIIPNVIVIPAAILGLALSYHNIWESLLGLMVGFGIIAVVIIASRGGMGWGDAKLLAMIGAFLGWQAVIYSLFIGSLFGAIVGGTLLLTKRIQRKTPVPFGPFLSLGAILWLFVPWWFR